MKYYLTRINGFSDPAMDIWKGVGDTHMTHFKRISGDSPWHSIQPPYQHEIELFRRNMIGESEDLGELIEIATLSSL